MIVAVMAGPAQAFTCREDRSFVLTNALPWDADWTQSRTVTVELSNTGSRYGMLRARSSYAGPQEMFRMRCLPSGRFAFKSTANARWVSAGFGLIGQQRGMLRASAKAIGPWETFTFTDTYPENPNGFGALRSVTDGLYVSGERSFTGDDRDMLRARATSIGAWEQFTISWVPPAS
jgi:hypothetical protein